MGTQYCNTNLREHVLIHSFVNESIYDLFFCAVVKLSLHNYLLLRIKVVVVKIIIIQIIIITEMILIIPYYFKLPV